MHKYLSLCTVGRRKTPLHSGSQEAGGDSYTEEEGGGTQRSRMGGGAVKMGGWNL